MNEELPEGINLEESFVVNLVRIAKLRKVQIKDLSATIGIEDTKLAPYGLKKNPYPSRDIMTEKQAEDSIALVAPDLAEYLRALVGYPEPTADIFMQKFVSAQPENHNLQLLNDASFGQVFRLNRMQVPVAGRLVLIKDCIIPEAGIARLSEIERGLSAVRLSTAFQLISILGYRPDENGFDSFCIETAEILRLYLIRQEKFGKSVFIHLYPDGNSRVNSRESRPVNQLMILEALGTTSPSSAKKLFSGEIVPTPEQVEKIIALFGYRDETKFYTDADALYSKSPNTTPPTNRYSESASQFGKIVKLIREEIGVTQTCLQSYMTGSKPDSLSDNSYVSRIELGERKMPLSDDEKLLFAKAFGLNNIPELSSLASQVELLRQFRADNFGQAIECLASNKNETAIKIIFQKGGDKSFTPVQVRDTCKMLDMTEPEIYQTASITVPEPVSTALEKLDEFLNSTPLKDAEKKDRVGRRTGDRHGEVKFGERQ